MPEVAHSAEDHHDTTLVRSVDDLLVTHRAPRLNDALGTCIDHHIQPIAEREESVARHCSPCQRQPGVLGFDAGYAG